MAARRQKQAVKRFYRVAAHVPSRSAWQITLDGKPVRTPRRNLLIVDAAPLAEAIVAEWSAQGDKVEPRTMPLTGLSNAAVDHVAADRRAFAASLASYGESDLICYRAEGPDDLVRQQSTVWDPLVRWASHRFGAELSVTSGIAHVAQDRIAIERLAAALEAMNDFQLAALQPLVTISGSLVIALAIADGKISADEAFDAGHLDELYQAEKWGDDAEALAARLGRKIAFNAAARMLTLLRLSPEQTTS
jgi:chaperone required for assembly of F1-ATPase